MGEVKPRTTKQNSSLHSTLEAYAEKLNDAGFDYTAFMAEVAKKGFQVDWTKENLKPFFNGVSMALYGKTSSELSTEEMIEAYRRFEHIINMRSGVDHAWHSNEEQMLNRGE